MKLIIVYCIFWNLCKCKPCTDSEYRFHDGRRSKKPTSDSRFIWFGYNWLRNNREYKTNCSLMERYSLVAKKPLEEISASLYSIDGRLFKEKKIYISTQGEYIFDANGFSERFGIMILKISNEVIAKKVFF